MNRKEKKNKGLFKIQIRDWIILSLLVVILLMFVLDNDISDSIATASIITLSISVLGNIAINLISSSYSNKSQIINAEVKKYEIETLHKQNIDFEAYKSIRIGLQALFNNLKDILSVVSVYSKYKTYKETSDWIYPYFEKNLELCKLIYDYQVYLGKKDLDYIYENLNNFTLNRKKFIDSEKIENVDYYNLYIKPESDCLTSAVKKMLDNVSLELNKYSKFE